VAEIVIPFLCQLTSQYARWSHVLSTLNNRFRWHITAIYVRDYFQNPVLKFQLLLLNRCGMLESLPELQCFCCVPGADTERRNSVLEKTKLKKIRNHYCVPRTEETWNAYAYNTLVLKTWGEQIGRSRHKWVHMYATQPPWAIYPGQWRLRCVSTL
jgi:hypothetical protein